MAKKKDTHEAGGSEEKAKKITSKLVRRGVSERFFKDENGNFWEQRGMAGGRNFFVPAPPWAGNINAYLFEGPNIYPEPQRKPLCDVPEMRAGGKVSDGGNLILSDEEKIELLRTNPHAEMFIRPYMMGKDFINRITRWCLWMVGAEPADIRKCPRILERLERVREFRLASSKEATRRKADTPMLFDEPIECTQDYIAIPAVSSSNRRYIPIEWVSRNVIPGTNIRFLANANLYLFGVLVSSVHNAWGRIVSGRLRNDYRYNNTITYNAFPFPELVIPPRRFDQPAKTIKDNPHFQAVERTAQAILDARSLYPRSTLADLYDERTMPPELRRAHRANDEAVMGAYGFTRHYEDERLNDEDIATNLLYRYKELTGCPEYSESYPNRELWEAYYGDSEDGDEDSD